jgi:hypothetical protein
MEKIEILTKLKNSIESMDKNNQIEVLRLLHKNDVFLNENKNGIYVNITELDDDILEDIYKFVEYIDTQEDKLNHEETEKQKYKNTFFINNKDNCA